MKEEKNRKQQQSTRPLITSLKSYNLSKNVKNILKKINPILHRENNIRIHFEALKGNLITEEEFKTIDAKMQLGKMALQLESIIDDIIVSILFYDKEENTIYHGAAPSIPVDFFDFFGAVNQNKLLNKNCASCGRAIYEKEIVHTDINTSELWANLKDYPLQWGLKSCLSIPFFIQGDVCGTFAYYSRTPNKIYTENELQILRSYIKMYEQEIHFISQQIAQAPSEKKRNTHNVLNVTFPFSNYA